MRSSCSAHHFSGGKSCLTSVFFFFRNKGWGILRNNNRMEALILESSYEQKQKHLKNSQPVFGICEAIHNDQSTNTPHVRYPHEKQSLNNPNKQFFFAQLFRFFHVPKNSSKRSSQSLVSWGALGVVFFGGERADAWSENWPWFTWRWTPWKRRYPLWKAWLLHSILLMVQKSG